MMINQVGSYKGVDWVRKCLCDVLYDSKLKQAWYFIKSGELKDNHYRTQKEMFAAIDNSIGTTERM